MAYSTPVHANWIQPEIWHCGQVRMAALEYLSFSQLWFCLSLTAMIYFHFPPAKEDGRVVFLEGLLSCIQFTLDLLLILRTSCKVHLCSSAAAGGGNYMKHTLHRGWGAWAWNSVKCFVLVWQFMAGMAAMPRACFNFVQIWTINCNCNLHIITYEKQ